MAFTIAPTLAQEAIQKNFLHPMERRSQKVLIKAWPSLTPMRKDRGKSFIAGNAAQKSMALIGPIRPHIQFPSAGQANSVPSVYRA